jgi:hypothetical protein
MAVIAESLKDLTIQFASKAGETGKLYGSITTEMLADAIKEKTGHPIDRHQIVAQPIRNLGEHTARVHLTVDLTPEIKVIVFREGEVAPGTEPEETKSKKKVSKKETAGEAEAVTEAVDKVETVEPAADAAVEETVEKAVEEPAVEPEASAPAEAPEGVEKGE